MKKYRIAILIHEKDRQKHQYYYLIDFFADFWRADGHEVFCITGTKEFVPADVIFVHVDLSVVPDEYLEFARQYPVVINSVKDIRKSTFSENILRPLDGWKGKVIVKTNNNAAGIPERGVWDFKKRVLKKIGRLTKTDLTELHFLSPSIPSKYDYPIFDHISDVPKYYFYHPDLIVQKFIPEIEKDYYCSYILNFLGDRMLCIKLKGKHPIVTVDSAEEIEYPVEPSPEILAKIAEFGFDYGKFDYVLSNGKAILLDINKTTGGSEVYLNQSCMGEFLHYGAKGLYELIEPKRVVHSH